MVKRSIEELIQKYLFKNKAIIIYGARQVGKTTLVESLVKNYTQTTLLLNGDDSDIRDILSETSVTKLKPIIGNHKIVVLDEAQRIPETGMVLKIIHDNFKDIQLIATGSSAFELANKIKEPLTGRKFEFYLHPLSFGEMANHHNFLTEKRLLEHRLIYGYYPDIKTNKVRIALREMRESNYWLRLSKKCFKFSTQDKRTLEELITESKELWKILASILNKCN